MGLIGIPMTFPPEPVNGYMISGWPVPSDESIFTSPPELHTELISRIGPYMIDKTFASLRRGNSIEMLAHLYKYTDMRRDASLYLLREKGPFDLFTVVFRGTDFIQHEAFKFRDEAYSKRNPEISLKFRDVILRFYEKMDSIMAEIIDAMGENHITIIMSDHGAGPMEKRFYINRWLRKEGLLSVKKTVFSHNLSIRKKSLSVPFQRVGASYMNAFLPSRLKNMMCYYPLPVKKHPSGRVDWENTKAFANLTWTDGLMRINLKGREPRGIVDREAYDGVREEIARKLLALLDPENGKRVVEKVFKREDVYQGPYLEDAPDLLVLTNNTSYVFSPAIDDGPFLERPENPAPAPHRMEGIFIARGPNIRSGNVLSDLNITDIAPSILYLLGKSIPRSIDGKIIIEAIDAEFLNDNPPVYYNDNDSCSGEGAVNDFSAEEKRKIEEGLKALGYME